MVVGGGILGTMRALFAVASGARVVHFDRHEQPRGASVRNFGLVWVGGRCPGAELRFALRPGTVGTGSVATSLRRAFGQTDRSRWRRVRQAEDSRGGCGPERRVRSRILAARCRRRSSCKSGAAGSDRRRSSLRYRCGHRAAARPGCSRRVAGALRPSRIPGAAWGSGGGQNRGRRLHSDQLQRRSRGALCRRHRRRASSAAF